MPVPWLQVIDAGWLEFIYPRGNGCLETYRSFAGKPKPMLYRITVSPAWAGVV